MIIQELECKAFGGLHEKKLLLSPGINLITGGNETGKTTVFSFIRCMLYGMRRGRGRSAARDDYHRLIPWDQTAAEGSLCFSCQGRNFRLHRIFRDRQERAELFCTDDGEVLDVAMGDLQMLLGGLGEGLYENVVSGRMQTEWNADLWKSLENYLLNMETVQEEQTDVETAVRLLEERIRAARTAGKRLEKERLRRSQELNSQVRYVEQRQAQLQEKIAQMKAQSRKVQEEQKQQNARDHHRQGQRWLLLPAAIAFFVASFFFLRQGNLLFMAVGAAAGLGLLGFFAAGRRRWEKGQAMEDSSRLQELHARIAQLQEELLDAGQARENCLEEVGELDQALPGERQARTEELAAEDARDRIRKVSAALSGNWADRLMDQASEILRSITGGRYFGIRVDTENRSGTAGGTLTVTDGARIYQPEQLSTGTGDQIRMAARLSAAMLLEEEPMPLIFDDAFLTWDDRRLSQLLHYLAGCGRQVLIFTGQNREELLLIGEKLSYHKIILDEF